MWRSVLLVYFSICVFYGHRLWSVCGAAATSARSGLAVSRQYRVQLTKMLSILDEDADPCEDFFEHACGYYAEYMADEYSAERNDVADDGAMPLSPFLYNQQDRVNFFEHNRINFDTTPGRILNELYADCKDRYRYDVWRGKPLPQWQRMLRELPMLRTNASLFARWPLLQHQWLALSDDERALLDWQHLAADFAAHGIPSLLKVYYAAGTIFVAPLLAAEDVDCLRVATLKQHLLTLLKSGRQQVAHVLASELVNFCLELTGQLPVDADIAVAASVANAANATKHMPTNDETFASYFDLYFERLNLTVAQVASARIITIDAPRLRQVGALLRATAPRIVLNYVLWRAYESLRYEDCYELTAEFEPLLLAEYWHWRVFEALGLSRNVAMAMYIYQTTRFQQHRRVVLMGEHWDRFLYARLQRSDFNVPRLLANFAQNHLDASNLTLIYGGGSALRPGAFYGNLLYLRRQQLRHSFFAPHIDAEDYNHPLHFLRHFLQFTILSLQRPLFHYFATLGFDLWHKSDLLYSTDGLYTALDCLERQSLLYFDDAPIFQVLEEPAVAAVFRFYRAFIESYLDYKFWLAGESFAFAEDFVLEHFQLNSQRIMFYAVAQLYCGRNDAHYGILINRSFMNMPQFAQAFSCDAEAPMNPLVKCMASQCV